MAKNGEVIVEEALLEGHLGVTRELLAFQTAERKFFIGCQPGGINLIKVCARNFIASGSTLNMSYELP